MADTTIEWTNKTWNPTVGCSIASPGCARCYAMRMAARLERMGQTRYAGLTIPSKTGAVWKGIVREAPAHTLLAPLAWTKPKLIFVNSMSDLFHEDMPDITISKVFDVMRQGFWHTFQILTKRDQRMRTWCTANQPEPLPNVWLGVSIEDRQRKSRLDHLRMTPAFVRFVSAEPLLSHLGELDLSGIHQVIAGDESGPGARERCNEDAVRSIRDQCAEQNVAFFYKQRTRNGRTESLPPLDGSQHAAMPLRKSLLHV